MVSWPTRELKMEPLTACMAYLSKLPNANSGSGGHNATLRAALACKRFGLSRADMWQAMTWWNDNRCTPRWSEKELRHKIDSVADLSVKKPLGKQSARHHARHVFVAPERPKPKAVEQPIYQRDEWTEELWWEKVATERGLTVEDLENGLLQARQLEQAGQDTDR